MTTCNIAEFCGKYYNFADPPVVETDFDWWIKVIFLFITAFCTFGSAFDFEFLKFTDIDRIGLNNASSFMIGSILMIITENQLEVILVTYSYIYKQEFRVSRYDQWVNQIKAKITKE